MKNSHNHLVAGPWIGEFGWEIFAWHGYIRALSRKYDKTTVICNTGAEYFYSDFANQIINFDLSVGPRDSFFQQGVDTIKLCKEIFLKNKEKLSGNVTLFPPRRIGYPPMTSHEETVRLGSHTISPEYLQLGSSDEGSIKYDYIFHIRERKNIRPQDNWSIDNWKELRSMFPDNSRVACIGKGEMSSVIPGTDDLRDIGLQDLCNIISSSSFVFGPSSGPMHLSSVCGTPHVVWSTPKNKDRYEKKWNPLGTPVLFLSEHSWHPSAEYVYKNFMDWKNDL